MLYHSIMALTTDYNRIDGHIIYVNKLGHTNYYNYVTIYGV